MIGIIVTLLTVSIPLSSAPQKKPMQTQPQIQIHIATADYYGK